MSTGQGYLQLLDEELQLITEALTQGSANSFEEYKRLVGTYQGLMFAKSQFEALLQKVENDDE